MATTKMQTMKDGGRDYDLKKYIRAGGYTAKWNKEAWLFAGGCTAALLQKANETYISAFQSAFGENADETSKLIDLSAAPTFGGDLQVARDLIDRVPENNPRNVSRDTLIHELTVMCCVVQSEFPEIECCPQLPFFVVLLLTHLSPAEAFLVLTNIIKEDKMLAMKWHFTLTRYRWRGHVSSSFQIAAERCPILAKHFALIGVDEKCIDMVMKPFLSEFLSYETLIQMTAPFIHEGSKVILRFLIAFFQLRQSMLLECANATQFVEYIRNTHANASWLPVDAVVSNAFAIPKLKKLDIHRRITRIQGETTNTTSSATNTTSSATNTTSSSACEQSNLKRNEDEIALLDDSKGQQQDCTTQLQMAALGSPVMHFHIPRWCEGVRSHFLTDEHLIQLWKWLPETRLQMMDAKLIFSTKTNGHNLRLLYDACALEDLTFLVIQDTKHRIFGGFALEAWVPGTHVRGTLDSFLFALTTSPPQKFGATRTNEMFQIATRKSVQMGGGGDGAGLYIAQDVQEGHSHWCETFNNDTLCGEDETFDIVVLEIWGLRSPSLL